MTTKNVTSKAGSAPAPGLRASAGRSQRNSPWVPVIFLAPFLVLFTMFTLVPAFYGIWISLHDWDFTLPGKPFIGMQNYKDLFDSTSVNYTPFWNGMKRQHLAITARTVSGVQGMAPSMDVASRTACRFSGSPSSQVRSSWISSLV